MVDYPYMPVLRALNDFFKKIKTMGVPEKITTGSLPQLGFKSSNHKPLVPILMFLGFLDSSNKPTIRYEDFRIEEKSKSVMAEALREAYSELFILYPDAYNRSEQTLRDFFASKTKAGEQVIQKNSFNF